MVKKKKSGGWIPADEFRRMNFRKLPNLINLIEFNNLIQFE